MLKILGQLPKDKFAIAVSGGSDSMAILNFLSKTRKKDITVLFFDHQTKTSFSAMKFLEKYCQDNQYNLVIGSIQTEKNKDTSWEEYWRNERLKFFHSFKMPVITGHNLDDAVETYLFNACNGKLYSINYQNKNVIRPFLLTKKENLKKWCEQKQIPYIEDETNQDVNFARNRIRHLMVPQALLVNPGLYTVMQKMVLAKFKEDTLEINPSQIQSKSYTKADNKALKI